MPREHYVAECHDVAQHQRVDQSPDAHLNGGQIDDARLLSEESVEAMQRITSRGSKRDFGLGRFRSREATQRRLTFVEHLLCKNDAGSAFFVHRIGLFEGAYELVHSLPRLG